MNSYYLIFKAIHFIGFTAWFAGLFYLVRILIYLREAQDKSGNESRILNDQFSLMAKRVYYFICNPAMIVTWIAGLSMILINGMDWFGINWWMHVKLMLLLVLLAYHFYSAHLMNAMVKGVFNYSSSSLRFLNEVPTLILIAVVSIAVFRNTASLSTIFIILLFFGILFFRATRKK